VTTITVKDILTSEGMKGSKVVAGKAGLNREVQAVAIGEIPDIGKWLHGGDFVHTTAWFMREGTNESEIGEWTRELVRNGAAALGIKTKRFITEIPQIIIDIGNEFDFAIIELPSHATQASVNEGIMNLIMDYQAEILIRSQNALECLMETMLNGYDLRNVADILTKLIGNPVVIESATFKLLAATATAEESQELLVVRRSEEFLAKLKKRYSNIKLENIEGTNKKTLRDMYMSKMELKTESSSCMQITLPVLVTGKLYGFLSVLEFENKLTEPEFAILDQSNMLIALELYKQKISFMAEERCRSEFLSLLLDGENGNGQIIKQSAEILGFNYRKPSLAIIVKLRWVKAKVDSRQIVVCFMEQDVTQIVIEILSRTDPNVFVVGRNEDMVIFYHPQSANSDSKTDEKGWNVCKRIQDTIESMFNNMDIVIGMGRISNDLGSLRDSYEEACKAIWIAEKFCANCKILDYRDLGYFRLLESEVRDEKKALQYCYDVMGKLIEFDKKDQHDLIETLYMFLEKNCSYLEVAKLMHIHVHTVQYRLKKVKKMLFIDFDKMEGRVNLWLALKIYKYLKSQEGIPDEIEPGR